ncbi:L37A1 protein, partial [Indicator maculatus]|nr:L37A1 protein [Indicator maculatus]
IQIDLDAVEQTKKAPGMEAVEDAEGAESPRQDYVWTYTGHKQRHSQDLPDHNQLLYRTPGKVHPEEEPPPTEGKAEQRPVPSLVVNNSPPAATSMLEDTAEEEESSLETHWKQEKEGSSFPLPYAGSSYSSERESAEGELFEAKVHPHLLSLVPEEALRSFVARVAQTLRGDCSLPELQPACAKLLLKTGLLIKLLSQRQDQQGASVPGGQCVLEGNVSIGVAKEVSREHTGREKAEHTFSDSLLLGLAVVAVIMINLLVICLVEVHSQNCAAASHPQSSRRSHQRGFFQRLLPRGWSKNKDDDEEGSLVWNPTQIRPQWLQDLFKPLDPQQERAMAELCLDTSDEEIFSRSQTQ